MNDLGIFNQSKTNADSIQRTAGGHLGTIAGIAPPQGVPQFKDATPRVSEPPAYMKHEAPWFTVSYFQEINARGFIARIICFACAAVWSGSWQIETIQGGRRCFPKSVEGGLIYTDQGPKKCTCGIGQNIAREIQTANSTEINQALTWKAGLSKEGYAVAHGSKSPRAMIAEQVDTLKKVRAQAKGKPQTIGTAALSQAISQIDGAADAIAWLAQTKLEKYKRFSIRFEAIAGMDGPDGGGEKWTFLEEVRELTRFHHTQKEVTR